MAYSTTQYLDFVGTVAGTTLTPITTGTDTTIALTAIVDDGSGDIIDTGDTFLGNGYSGFTIDIGGNIYALFGGPVVWIIPNDGELTTGILSNPTYTLTAADPVTQATVNCFLPGTGIEGEVGEVAVEDLKIGDLLRKPDGSTAQVTWLWSQKVSTLFNVAERLLPVRVSAGALGGGLPKRDLVLTSDHAFLIDGMLVNAGALVNGGTIDWVSKQELGNSYMVYHVETEAHDIILAEGTPSETYIDYVARSSFDNYADYVAIYGDERTIAELPYTRVSSARLLPESLRARLATAKVA